MHPQVTALLLLDGVIPSEKFASVHGLEGEEKTQFIQRIQGAITQKNVTEIAQEIAKLPKINVDAEPRSNKVNPRIEIDLKYDKSSDGSSAVSGESDYSKILPPAVVLAYSIIQFARNPESRKDLDQQLTLSAKLTDQSYHILKETLLSDLSDVAGGTIATVLNLGLNFVKEYQYRRNEAEVQNEFKEIIQKGEVACLNLYQTLRHVKAHYISQLSELTKKTAVDATLYQKKLEEWLVADRYIHTQLEAQHQKIAIAGMMTQETQSKRRYERVVDVFETILPAISLAAPPLIAGNLIIKGISKIGGMVSDSMIRESAELNHSVVSSMDSLLITDADSIQEAEEQLAQLVSPSIALSGPVLKTHIIEGVNIERVLKTDRSLAKSLVKNLGTRSSCSFSLSKPIPEIPLVEPALPGHHFGNDPELKKKGKQQLEKLIDMQKDILEEISLLEWISIELMRAYKPWPYVNNLGELTQSLTDAHQAIVRQQNEIQKQFGEDYANNSNSEGTKMLARSKAQEKYIEKHLLELKALQIQLQETPHSALYSNGIPVFSANTTEEQRKIIIDKYSSNEEARRMLLRDIEFNLNAIDSLVTHCEKLGKGRHIQNLATSVSELDAQLFLLEKSYQKAASEVSVDDKATIVSCKKLIEKLSERGALLDKGRIEYIANERNREKSERDKYQEYLAVEQDLVTYHVNLPDNDLLALSQYTSNEGVSSIFQSLNKLKSDMALSLELELRNPSPIDLDQLPLTDRIIAPNRAHFGFYKHETMLQDVNSKFKELFDDEFITTIQIMPRGISEALLAKCKGQFDSLQKAIEGLKTEIQWASNFQQLCDSGHITIANKDNLIRYYEEQIQLLEAVCQNKTQRLGGTLTSSSTLSTVKDFKARLQNTIHELTNPSEKELDKVKAIFEQFKNSTATSSSANVTQSYRDGIANMHAANLPSPSTLEASESQGPDTH